jgi:hypothetical protein
MADNDGLSFAERGNQRDHVADVIENGVGTDIVRRAGLAESAHIRRDNMIPCSGNRRDLVPPGIGQFGPAMAKHHERPGTLFEQKHLDPVGGDRA